MLEDNEVFIHVGIPKTASSFLQRKIFPIIPNVKLIATPYTQFNTAFNMLQYADDTLYSEEIVIEELKKYNHYKKIIISEESFSGSIANLMGNNRTQNANRLKKLIPNASIILFIRGQKEVLFSAYNQYIKTHGGKRRMGHYFRFANLASIYKEEKQKTAVPNAFMNFVPNHSHIELFKYYNLIKLYKSLFRNVNVFLYEDFCTNPQQTISQLETIFQEKMPANQVINFTEKVNRSMKKKEVEKQLFFNKSRFLFRKKHISDLFFFLHKIKYNKSFLEQEQKFIEKMLKDYFKADNNKIINEFPEIKLNLYPNQYDL